ncbi:MAG: hypothetical protein ACT4OZ_03560 [Gemmatimonadota bacterium]
MITAFVLSPARLDGERGRLLLDRASTFPLAVQLRTAGGAELGTVFSFISALYFRGKIFYAGAFCPEPGTVSIITTDRGLCTPALRVKRVDLIKFRDVDLGAGDSRFIEPLLRDATELDGRIGSGGRVILLGSIATGKYIDPLLSVFGDRLLFPASFVGRGDMSRGGILLRSARSGVELDYIPVAGAVRHGERPPRLERLPRSVAPAVESATSAAPRLTRPGAARASLPPQRV